MIRFPLNQVNTVAWYIMFILTKTIIVINISAYEFPNFVGDETSQLIFNRMLHFVIHRSEVL